MCIPWDFLPSPAFLPLYPLAEPGGITDISGQRQRSCRVPVLLNCLLIFTLANRGSYRKFDQSEGNIVSQPPGPSGYWEE